MNPPSLADLILQSGTRFARDASGRLFVYRDGVYVPEAHAFIRREIKRILSARGVLDAWKPALAPAVANFIMADADRLLDAPSRDVVNVANGLLRLLPNGPCFTPHDPDYLTDVQLPAIYDPTATCPAWDDFVRTTFPTDSYDLAYEIIGWILAPDNSLQRFVFLTGSGSNGKSIYLAGLRTFVGEGNVASYTIQDLACNRFASAGLQGKLANLASEIPADRIMSTGLIKAISSGDAIKAERKMEHAFQFRPFCRLLFSANILPPASDPTVAWSRRVLVVPFPRKFDRKDPTTIDSEVLEARLADPRELSGLLNRALAGLYRLRAQRDFSIGDSVRRATEEYLRSSNPVSDFVQDSLVVDPAKWISKHDLFDLYTSWARDERHSLLTETGLGLAIQSAVPGIKPAQRKSQGKKKAWVWIGIGRQPFNPFDLDSYRE